MGTRSYYLKKANACADAAKKAREPAERVTLLQVSLCFILLADYVAARQEHGTVRREDEQRAAPPSGGLSGESQQSPGLSGVKLSSNLRST
jgi:hypothetical protein